MKIGYEYGEIEMYDFVSTENGTKGISMIADNGWRVVKNKMGKSNDNIKYAIYNYYSPALQFFRIWRMFHGNGMIRRRGTFMCGVPFDIAEEFDEDGKLIKYFDHNQEFGRIKPMDVVHILEKEGWFNRETGEQKIIHGIDRFPTNGEFTYQLFRPLFMKFRYHTDNQLWQVGIKLHVASATRGVGYSIDGNTGEFTKFISEPRYAEY